RALKSVLHNIGAQWVSLIEEGLAAALGVGVIVDSRASMVVDIGGGTTNITIASTSGIIYTSSMRAAGNAMNQAVKDHILRKYRIIIGEQIAEMVKIKLGGALPVNEVMPSQVRKCHWYTPPDLLPENNNDDEDTIRIMGKSITESFIKEV